MAQETIYWQMIDLNSTISENNNLDEILQKNFLKTSNYSFIKPMQIWAVLTDKDKSILEQLQNLWTSLWQAFQIRDDLKDIVLDTKKSNKSRFNDITEWAQTIFTNYVLQKAWIKDKIFLKSCMWKKLKKDQISQLQNIFEKSWAIKYWYELIKQNLSESQKILDEIKFDNMENKKHFEEIIYLISKI